ncbi:MAG: aspartate kinase [Candidatus Nitrosocaldus sp.]|nr:aspartate kinase [Candidatus Nitrosocaldus sp.]MDW8276153.1 aspartate kinase [Candidatus Nitrosocaldus sp.]
MMKFGGNAVSSVERIRHVARDIVARYVQNQDGHRPNHVVAVVSAIKGVTDDLIQVCDSIVRGECSRVESLTKSIEDRHRSIASQLCNNESYASELSSIVDMLIKEMNDLLRGMMLLNEVTPRSRDYLLSFGERLMAPMLCYALKDIGIRAEHLTGKDAGIVTDSNYGDARPLMDTTRLRVRHRLIPMLEQEGVVPVVTGFIGSDQHGNITTLGRGGSDYTATIIASCIDADEVMLWTDVDGLMTADPRMVRSAQVLREVSYAEAMEMALFGAKYLHPRALEPVLEKGIPIRIRNVFNPDCQGTTILKSPAAYPSKIVKAVTAIRSVSLIDVRGSSMVGSPGTAGRIFNVLGDSRINIIMISQGPSESSISMVVRRSDLDNAVNALELNLLGRLIKGINVTDDVAIIAVVGSGMRGTKGVAARVFGAVAKQGINVIMIAQGSSELNLAFVVEDKHAEDAVRALHDEFELDRINQ